MKVILLSEHYKPRLGGVTSYVDQISNELAKLGFDIWLITPGENEGDVQEEVSFGKWIRVGLGIDLTRAISSHLRVDFSKRAAQHIEALHKSDGVDAIHVLFGFYLMRHLDLSYLPSEVKRVCSIHNVPPQESSISWKGDTTWRYWADRGRQILVSFVNRRRIKWHKWDTFIVPSEGVKDLLSRIVNTDIRVIHHGCSGSDVLHRPEKNVMLCTISGITPHKELHIIPSLAKELKEAGLDLEWNIIGQIKNDRYYRYLLKQVHDLGLNDTVMFRNGISEDDKKQVMAQSMIYVHPSREEGFCLAVLEAAEIGLPIVARPVGAIPEIVRMGEGFIANSYEDFFIAIGKLLTTRDIANSKASVEKLRDHFSCERSAQKHALIYQGA